MNYTFIPSKHEIKVLLADTNEIVEFETKESIENHEYSTLHVMDGYVSDELKYQATGEFEKGSDNFIELTDIEPTTNKQKQCTIHNVSDSFFALYPYNGKLCTQLHT